jgi:hypothetical protein
VDGVIGNGAHVGASIGRLEGNGRQNVEGGSLYRYDYGDPGDLTASNASTYRSGSLQDQEANREGSSTYGTVFLRRDLAPDRTLTLSYRGNWSDLSMGGYSITADSSRSLSQSQYDNNRYRYESSSVLSDRRDGDGSGTGTTHRLSAGLEWTLGPKSRLVIGAVGIYDRQSIETREDASVLQSSYWDNQWSEGSTSRRDQSSFDRDEVKEVIWEFSSRRSTLHVPVVLWHTISEQFEVMAGVTRQMTDSRVADETLALFEYRHLSVDGRQTREQDFGERYREPTAYRTEITTSVLLGLTVRPSPHVDIRLLASPRWSTLWQGNRTQWWLGLQLRP